MSMRDVILQQADQIRTSLEANKGVRVEGTFDAIVLAGMGGSWHPGEIINTLKLAKVPLSIHRDYDLPRIYSKHPLIVVSSYSGNTEEALSAYRAAQEAGYQLLINTSGGKLAEWSQRDGVPWAKIAFPGMQPRHTTLASFTGMYAVLQQSGLVEDITADLLRLADILPATIAALEAGAKALSEKLADTLPVYYASDALAYVAWNFKIQTNENAKYPAFWNKFPELNHNEMLGFSQLNSLQKNGTLPPLHAVFLRDADDHPRNRARMDVTQELYRQWGVQVSTFEITGRTLPEKLFTALIFGLWTTYYLAQHYNVDPVPVGGVEDFKKRLVELAGEI